MLELQPVELRHKPEDGVKGLSTLLVKQHFMAIPLVVFPLTINITDINKTILCDFMFQPQNSIVYL